MTARHYDNTALSWSLRDRDVERAAERIRTARGTEAILLADASALDYLTLAADAGQSDRLLSWALLFGIAQNEREVSGS